jgi:diacylglycerol kinase (ATP)
VEACGVDKVYSVRGLAESLYGVSLEFSRRSAKFFVMNFARRASYAGSALTAAAVFVSMAKPVADLSKFLRENKSVVFVNPVAGAGRAERNLRRVRGAFERAEIATEFLVAASATEMETRVRAAIVDGARLLFAMGGDGTVQAVLNGVGVQRLGESGVVVGVLPSGGGNDFATALRLPKDPAAVVAGLSMSMIRSVDVLRARTGDGATRLFVGGGGVGLDVEAARHASGSYRRWPGRSRYLASALRAWRGFEPIGVRVEFPDDDLPVIDARAMLAAVLNTPSYGAGLRVAPDAHVDDGWLDVAVLKNLSRAQVGRAIPRLFARGTLPEFRVVRRKARTVVIQTDRDSMFHGDGEILGPAPVRIEVVPNAIQVLAPAGNEARKN